MNYRNTLTTALEKLEAELSASGKADTAAFFQGTRLKIDNEANPKKLKAHLQELCSSGSISQYANFSHHEDQLFDHCFEAAQSLLSTL